MAQQSKSQKETVERVMHEFKHGELETGAGKTVRSRKQAVAIGLSEAGASNQQSPEENRDRARKTRQKEGKDAGGPTKADLMARARERKVAGRSKMTKKQLENALK